MNLPALLFPLLALAAGISQLGAALTRGPADAAARSDGAQPAAPRARSPEGLAAFLDEHKDALAAGDPEVERALDAVCAQHDCRRAPLYWHTDLEEAKARARRERKPILSLHLLGRLDEPLSCANSRFFRALLYPDPRVTPLLREQVVLHWHTVRPVPKVTIDFGDGRRMERTLTGNSAHYLLDEDGRPLDVLPGMFAPAAFSRTLEAGIALHAGLEGLRGEARSEKVRAWHQERLAGVVAQWTRALDGVGQGGAVHKGVPAQVALNLLQLATRDEDWGRIAARRPVADAVSAEAFGASRSRFPDAWTAGRVAPTKAMVEDPMLRGMREVAPVIHGDSVRNELQLRGRVHVWLGEAGGAVAELAPLNRRVYAELFLSPLDDPWYGLRPPRALEWMDDGVLVPFAQR